MSRASWPRAPALGDVVVAVAGLASAALLSWSRPAAGPAVAATVEVGGHLVRRLSLERPDTVIVQGPVGASVIAVEPGRARVVSAPCRQQICVRRGWVETAGDVAVCVPNRLVLRLEGAGPRSFDGVTR